MRSRSSFDVCGGNLTSEVLIFSYILLVSFSWNGGWLKSENKRLEGGKKPKLRNTYKASEHLKKEIPFGRGPYNQEMCAIECNSVPKHHQSTSVPYSCLASTSGAIYTTWEKIEGGFKHTGGKRGKSLTQILGRATECCGSHQSAFCRSWIEEEEEMV